MRRPSQAKRKPSIKSATSRRAKIRPALTPRVLALEKMAAFGLAKHEEWAQRMVKVEKRVADVESYHGRLMDTFAGVLLALELIAAHVGVDASKMHGIMTSLRQPFNMRDPNDTLPTGGDGRVSL